MTFNLPVYKRIYNFVEFLQTYFPFLFCFLSMHYKNLFMKGLNLINKKQKNRVILKYFLYKQYGIELNEIFSSKG